MSARHLAPCGTESAYRRHLRWGQPPCNACRVAHSRLQARYREKGPAPEPRELRPCGTDSAYRRHLRKREVPCRLCVDAHAAEVRAWAARKRAA